MVDLFNSKMFRLQEVLLQQLKKTLWGRNVLPLEGLLQQLKNGSKRFAIEQVYHAIPSKISISYSDMVMKIYSIIYISTYCHIWQ